MAVAYGGAWRFVEKVEQPLVGEVEKKTATKKQRKKYEKSVHIRKKYSKHTKPKAEIIENNQYSNVRDLNELKTCNVCGETKKASEFPKTKRSSANGFLYYYIKPNCKECYRAYFREYDQETKRFVKK